MTQDFKTVQAGSPTLFTMWPRVTPAQQPAPIAETLSLATEASAVPTVDQGLNPGDWQPNPQAVNTFRFVVPAAKGPQSPAVQVPREGAIRGCGGADAVHASAAPEPTFDEREALLAEPLERGGELVLARYDAAIEKLAGLLGYDPAALQNRALDGDAPLLPRLGQTNGERQSELLQDLVSVIRTNPRDPKTALKEHLLTNFGMDPVGNAGLGKGALPTAVDLVGEYSRAEELFQRGDDLGAGMQLLKLMETTSFQGVRTHGETLLRAMLSNRRQVQEHTQHPGKGDVAANLFELGSRYEFARGAIYEAAGITVDPANWPPTEERPIGDVDEAFAIAMRRRDRIVEWQGHATNAVVALGTVAATVYTGGLGGAIIGGGSGLAMTGHSLRESQQELLRAQADTRANLNDRRGIESARTTVALGEINAIVQTIGGSFLGGHSDKLTGWPYVAATFAEGTLPALADPGLYQEGAWKTDQGFWGPGAGRTLRGLILGGASGVAGGAMGRHLQLHIEAQRHTIATAGPAPMVARLTEGEQALGEVHILDPRTAAETLRAQGLPVPAGDNVVYFRAADDPDGPIQHLQVNEAEVFANISPEEVTQPLTEGTPVYRGLVAKEMDWHPLEQALGMGRDGVSSKKLARGLAQLASQEMGPSAVSQAVNPADVARARRIMASPDMPERATIDPTLSVSRQERANAKAADARSQWLQVEALTLRLKGQDGVADILDAQAIFEVALAAPEANRLGVLQRLTAELADRAPGAHRLLVAYERDLTANLASRGVVPAAMEAQQRPRIVPEVTPDRSRVTGTQTYTIPEAQAHVDRQMGEAMGTSPERFDLMVATALGPDNLPLLARDGFNAAYAAARSKVEKVLAEPAGQRAEALRREVAAIESTDNLQAELLSRFLNDVEQEVGLGGVTPANVARTLVGMDAKMPNPADLQAKRLARLTDRIGPQVRNDLPLVRRLAREIVATVAPQLKHLSPEQQQAWQTAMTERIQSSDSAAAVRTGILLAVPGERKVAATVQLNLNLQLEKAISARTATVTPEAVSAAVAHVRTGMTAIQAQHAKILKPLGDLPTVGDTPPPAVPVARGVLAECRQSADPVKQHDTLRQAIHRLAKSDRPEDQAAAVMLRDFHTEQIAQAMAAHPIVPRFHGTGPEVRVVGADGKPVDMATLPRELRQEIALAKVYISRLVDPRVVAEAGPLTLVVDPRRDRAGYHGEKGQVTIHADSTARSIIHEYGHQIEDRAGAGINAAARQLLLDRLGPDAEVRSIGSARQVTGQSEEYFLSSPVPGRGLRDPYVARLYGSGDTELVSMGLEWFHTDPAGFYQADPEHFALIAQIVSGAGLPQTPGNPPRLGTEPPPLPSRR